MRDRMARLRAWLERLLLWRAWERMLEIEFVDRSVALAGKAFVSFFPLIIVVAAFLPERARTSIITAVTFRLGLRGDALTTVREAFRNSDDVREATGLLGLVLTIFFATSFVTALQRMYLRAWRRPTRPGGAGMYWRGLVCMSAVLACMAALGGLGTVFEGTVGVAVLAILALAATSALWGFIPWFLLLGDVRARALVPTALITSVATAAFAISATIWMPDVVSSNEDQFGFFGVSLSLVTWFSGAAMCIIVGACAGAIFAEDTGSVGRLVRGEGASTLTAGAAPALPPPARELSLRDAFQSTEES
ncbi:MAG: hypothetical protein ABWZ15_05495 [Acidimicrobiia bacterium]